MKRVLGIVVVLLGAGALSVFGTGASNGSGGTSYWVELDDAFGLISGGDVKIAGVRAGKIGDMKVDEKTHRALVEIKIAKTGFGSIRTDVTCQARPQSLIGEYFIDCQPGTNPTELKPGATIPVSHTSSVVAPDLVNDVLRRPYRERFSIIVNELGAAVAGNAQNLNDAIRRASPGLRETDRVLNILARQNRVLADLVKNADKVIGDMADNKADVARWVQMADRTSAASAERRVDIARGWKRLPQFLEELRTNMAQLGSVATEQTPALRTLTEAAPNLKTFFDRLGPFADVSRPAIKALGQASKTGGEAVTAATPTVAELNKFSRGVPELGGNLSTILKHLDDPQYGAEPDPRAPDPKNGYTGLQALLQYVYDQVISINVYDQSVHILKVAPFVGDCETYSDVNAAQAPAEEAGKKRIDVCGAGFGPNSAGNNFPDTTRPANMKPYGAFPEDQQNPFAASATARDKKGRRARAATGVEGTPAASAPAAAQTAPATPRVPTLSDVIPGAPAVVIPSPPPAVQQAARRQKVQQSQTKLLDFLLGQ